MLSIIGILSFVIYWTCSFHSDSNYPDEKYFISINGCNYDLNNPSQKYVLENDLEEISGLSFLGNHRLVCVQDEDGILFVFDTKKEKVTERYKFGKKGDYEGVEVINDTAYVLESNGEVSYFRLSGDKNSDIEKIKTHLSSKNNTEGLGYYPPENTLLIVCKDDNESEKFETNDYAIYHITLKDLDFKRKPAFIISREKFLSALQNNGLDSKRHRHFKPSGIAVHPRTNDIFIISSVSKLMLVLDQEEEIKKIVPIKRELLEQPEGICFDENGNLFISSEGRGGSGYILKFDLKNE